MPIYDFRCECGNEFEDIFSVSEMPESVTCPECKKKAPRVIVTNSTGRHTSPNLQTDHPPWMEGVRHGLMSRSEWSKYGGMGPSRSEYNKIVKDKGLRFIPGNKEF